MSQKPSLTILDGERWQEALRLEAEAQAAGVSFSLPKLEEKLKEGYVVKVFDRTNAVFYLGLFKAAVGQSLDGLEPAAAVPRAMYLLGGLADLEAALAGRGEQRSVVLTGAPEEHDGLENHLSYHSSTAWLSQEGDRFRITLVGRDYDKVDELRAAGQWDNRTPMSDYPLYEHVFEGTSLKSAYIQAARFGQLDRDQRYLRSGMEPPESKAPFLELDLEPQGPRIRPSGLAEPGGHEI